MAFRNRFVIGLLAAACALSQGCVWAFDVKPGVRSEYTREGYVVDACTPHEAAAVFDVVFGTASLAGGVAGFIFGSVFGDSAEGESAAFIFNTAGVIGVAGAVLHYVSAGSTEAAQCREARKYELFVEPEP